MAIDVRTETDFPVAMGPNTKYSYDVFLSYSRETDDDTARQLQRLIRRVGRRWYRPSPIRVYRDRTNTPVSHDLSTTLKTAIDKSSYFVLLASPASAQSKWSGSRSSTGSRLVARRRDSE
jgi:hypothetical protein